MTKPDATNIEKELSSIDLIVSKSDAEGNITYVNPIFMKISGYTQGELLDEPHSILRHPDMPKVIFKYLWDNLKKGNEVVAYVKNLCKDGCFYWVLATIKTAKNPDGSFRNYMSTRRCITDGAKEYMTDLYSVLLEIEKKDGVEASEAAFKDFLVQENIDDAKSFNAFMQKLNV
jgi:PAS domain S-box-containing protein